MTIDVKAAVQKAREYAESLLHEENIVARNLALEEVDIDTESNDWLVTLGYDTRHKVTKTIPPSWDDRSHHPTVVEEQPREYKTFRIRASDGGLVNVKIRRVS